MFRASLSDGVNTICLLDACQLRYAVAAYGIYVSSMVQRTNLPVHHPNTVYIPQGEEPGRAWVFVPRSGLSRLNFYNPLSLTFSMDSLGVMTWYGLTLCREPQSVIPGYIANDPLGAVVLELADVRWRVSSPYRHVSCTKMYNVPANILGSTPTTYLASSLNGGSAWTWSQMVEDIWNLMSAQLGAFPGLPFAPDGAPNGWIVQGGSAWKFLNQVLRRIGCTVTASASTGQLAIVQQGAADPALDATLARYARRKIHDGEFSRVLFDPFGVRVHFRSVKLTPDGIPLWLQASPYTVDVAGPNPTAENAGIYHPIWDDLFAIYDSVGALTNASALASRAAERSADFFRMIGAYGAFRSWRRYAGLIDVAPGSTLKAVTWRATEEGVFTDLSGHGEPMEAMADYIDNSTATDLIRFGLPAPFTKECITTCEDEEKCIAVLDSQLGPCVPASASGTSAACGPCDSTPDTYCIPGFSGLTNGTCTDAAAFAIRPVTLARESFGLIGGGECSWAAYTTYCSDFTIVFELTWTDSSTIEFHIASTTHPDAPDIIIAYTATGDIDCNSPIMLT
ncbi:MAG TPA: hypothetical protein VFE62_03550, partial [Gemmataceae bacterium]|nr:hypothetical protein [Gemmataceae bacterium]